MDNDSQMQRHNDNLVRAILKNEITWLFMIVGGVMAFVTMVILPIQRIQSQLVFIQVSIEDNKSLNERIMFEHSGFKTRLDILETRFNNLK